MRKSLCGYEIPLGRVKEFRQYAHCSLEVSSEASRKAELGSRLKSSGLLFPDVEFKYSLLKEISG